MENFIQNQGAISAGDRFKHDRYTVIRHLGRGGQGLVLLVKDNKENVE
jgi:hypothetical protein